MHPPSVANLSARPSERRASERVPVDIDATLQVSSHFAGGRVTDVSEGGVCLAPASVALAVGDALAIAFPLDGEVVMARGEVRWVSAGNAGVAFTHISPFERKLIGAFYRRTCAWTERS